MTNHFAGCNLDNVRARYKDLAMMYHPDRGLPTSDLRIMQEVNDQYHSFLKSLDGKQFEKRSSNPNTTQKEYYTFRYDWKKEEELRAKIDQVIGLKLENITLEVNGSWIWIGNTSKDQASLFNRHGLGFKFSGEHVKWYWHKQINSPFKTRRSGLTYDQIKQLHGSETIEHERNRQIGS